MKWIAIAFLIYVTAKGRLDTYRGFVTTSGSGANVLGK